MAKLTTKQRLFVNAYLGEARGNATAAARLAGYVEHRVTGSRLLTNANIRAEIDARLDEACLPSAEILARLSEHATNTPEPFLKFGPDGAATIDLAQARDLGKLHLAKKIKHGRYGLEIELYDAQAALIQIGKYRRLWTDQPQAGAGDRGDHRLVIPDADPRFVGAGGYPAETGDRGGSDAEGGGD